eukprot:COSAG05_NODE_278_length_12330_cov_14.132205_7_plen_122_part_00
MRKPLQLDYTQVAPSTIKRLAKYIQHDALDPAIVGKTSLAALQFVRWVRQVFALCCETPRLAASSSPAAAAASAATAATAAPEQDTLRRQQQKRRKSAVAPSKRKVAGGKPAAGRRPRYVP